MKNTIIILFISFIASNIFAQQKPLYFSEEGKKLEMDDKQLEAFKERSLQKTKELGLYIRTLTEKTESKAKKSEAVKLALRLFMSKEAIVEVSSKNTEKVIQRKIEPYLNKLRVLPYDHIEITWYDIHYVSELRKGTDGNYYGTITVYQKFQAFKDGRIAYEDETQKNIDVILTKIEQTVGDEKIERWEVLLGNIAVEETK